MNNLPVYVSIFLMLVTFLTLFIFFKAAHNSKTTLLILLAWLTVQTIIGLSGFYTVTDSTPPRFALIVAPPNLLIIFLFVTAKGRRYIDSLNIRTLTLLHTVRIPVELILFALFVYKTVPELMTFEGRNFDIFSGITAPVIFYIGFIKKR